MTTVSEDKRWAYVTHSDIRSIGPYKDSTLLLVKAPPNTQLTVPPPSQGLQMHMKSEGGEIGVFLCPENENSAAAAGTGPTTSASLAPHTMPTTSSSGKHPRHGGDVTFLKLMKQ